MVQRRCRRGSHLREPRKWRRAETCRVAERPLEGQCLVGVPLRGRDVLHHGGEQRGPRQGRGAQRRIVVAPAASSAAAQQLPADRHAHGAEPERRQRTTDLQGEHRIGCQCPSDRVSNGDVFVLDCRNGRSVGLCPELDGPGQFCAPIWHGRAERALPIPTGIEAFAGVVGQRLQHAKSGSVGRTVGKDERLVDESMQHPLDFFGRHFVGGTNTVLPRRRSHHRQRRRGARRRSALNRRAVRSSSRRRREGFVGGPASSAPRRAAARNGSTGGHGSRRVGSDACGLRRARAPKGADRAARRSPRSASMAPVFVGATGGARFEQFDCRRSVQRTHGETVVPPARRFLHGSSRRLGAAHTGPAAHRLPWRRQPRTCSQLSSTRTAVRSANTVDTAASAAEESVMPAESMRSERCTAASTSVSVLAAASSTHHTPSGTSLSQVAADLQGRGGSCRHHLAR